MDAYKRLPSSIHTTKSSVGDNSNENGHIPPIIPLAVAANQGRKRSGVLADLEKLLDVRLQQSNRKPSFADVLSTARRPSCTAVGHACPESIASESSNAPPRCSSPLPTNRVSDSASTSTHSPELGDQRSGTDQEGITIDRRDQTHRREDSFGNAAPSGDDDDKRIDNTSISHDGDTTSLLSRRLENEQHGVSGGAEGKCGVNSDGVDFGEQEDQEESDAMTALREMLRSKEDDLRMAAIIGQRLLDTQEALTAELEASREEKWQADCEVEALKRDLDHATVRCAQLQEAQEDRPHTNGGFASRSIDADTSTEINTRFSSWPHDPATVSSDPADDFFAAGTRSSSVSDTASCAAVADASAAQEEIARLRQLVETLKMANSAVREELTEARLETSALRRVSAEWRKCVFRRQGSVTDEGPGQRRRRRSRSVCDDDPRDIWKRAIGDSDGIDNRGENNETSRRFGEDAVIQASGAKDGDARSLPTVGNREIAPPVSGEGIEMEPTMMEAGAVGERADKIGKDEDTRSEHIPLSGDSAGLAASESALTVAVAATHEEQITPMTNSNDLTCDAATRMQLHHQQRQMKERDNLIKILRDEMAQPRQENHRAGPTAAAGIAAGSGDRADKASPPGLPQISDTTSRRVSINISSDGDDDDSEGIETVNARESFQMAFLDVVHRNGSTARIAVHDANDGTSRSSILYGTRGNHGVEPIGKGGPHTAQLEAQIEELSTKLKRAELAFMELQRVAWGDQATVVVLQREIMALHRKGYRTVNDIFEERQPLLTAAAGGTEGSSTCTAGTMVVRSRNSNLSANDTDAGSSGFDWFAWLWGLLSSGCGEERNVPSSDNAQARKEDCH